MFIHNMFQQEEPLLNSKIYFGIAIIVFSRITTCGPGIMHAVIGEMAQLDFKYPCDSTKITLQHSYSAPFYNSNDPSSVLCPPNYLLENQNDTDSDECSLHLTINPVSRDNEGTYILMVYNGAKPLDFLKIGLRVDSPPGKASCEISSDNNNGKWVSLQCTAPEGALPWQIVCYQNDTRILLGNNLKESDEYLKEMILARLGGVVYCCSSILTGMKDKCDCTDWGWDPMSDNVFDIADPCPQALSTEDPTSTHIITTDYINSSSSNLVPVQAKYPENHKNTSYWIVTCALTMVISILAIIIVSIACKYRCKAKEMARLQSSLTPESTDPCLPVNGEEVV